jgi:hypothetical protein
MIRLTLQNRDISYLAFPDLGALAQAATGLSERSPDWAGATRAQAQRRAIEGNLDLVARADRLLDQIETDLDLSGLSRQSVPALAGGAPCVPAMLSGHPLTMRARRPVASPAGEVTILASAFISASISHDVIARRGAAVLALVRAVSLVRPVRLVIFYADSGKGTRSSLVSVPIETAPLDLARAAWALTAPEFLRQLLLPICDKTLGKDYNQGQPFTGDAGAAVAGLLGAESYLALPDLLSSNSTAFKTDRAALEWLQSNLATAQEI